MTKEKQPISYVVNSTTGEIIDEFNEGDSYKKITNEQKEYVNSHIKNFNKKEAFVKMYPRIISILAEELSPSEFSFLMKISSYVEYESCVLCYGKGRGKHDLTLKELSMLINIEYSRTTRIINSLIKKGIIGEFKTGNKKTEKINKIYVVNPYIYYNGNNIDKNVVNYFFNHSGWNTLVEE